MLKPDLGGSASTSQVGDEVVRLLTGGQRVVTNAAQMNELRVLILARDRLARAGLSALLDQQPGCVMVGQVGEYEELGPGLKVYQPDVVLWELGS